MQSGLLGKGFAKDVTSQLLLLKGGLSSRLCVLPCPVEPAAGAGARPRPSETLPKRSQPGCPARENGCGNVVRLPFCPQKVAKWNGARVSLREERRRSTLK